MLYHNSQYYNHITEAEKQSHMRMSDERTDNPNRRITTYHNDDNDVHGIIPTKAGKRQRRKILSEEEYSSTLSQIITRDYYPALSSLNRDAAILQKRSEGDISGAVAIRRAARSIAISEELNGKSEEVEELIASANGGIRKRPRPIERENVDGFHERVTSEDNADFEINMRQEAMLKRKQMDLVFNTSGSGYKNVGRMLLEHGTGTETDGGVVGNRDDNSAKEKRESRLSLCDTPTTASDEFNPPVQRIQAPGTTIDGENKTDRNSLFFIPNHYEALSTSKSSSTSTSTSIFTQSNMTLMYNDESANSTNVLLKDMPPPSSRSSCDEIVTSLPPNRRLVTSSRKNKSARTEIVLRSNQNMIQMKMQLVEYRAKPINMPKSNSEKQIIPLNTRFSFQNESRIVAASSNTMQRHTVEANSTECHKLNRYDTDSSTTDLDASPRPLDMERKARLRRVERDRNTFVTMTPIILPGNRNQYGGGEDYHDDDDDDDYDDNDSPIITWGNVASTPLVTGGDPLLLSNQKNSGEENEVDFRLPAKDDREIAAKTAASKVSKQTERFKQAGQMKGTGRKSISRARSANRHPSTFNFSDRASSLTPAARSLLERSTPSYSIRNAKKNHSLATLNSSARSSSAFGSALRSSYTPNIHKSSRSRSLQKSHIHNATPIASSNGPRHTSTYKISNEAKDGGGTSGLLKLA